MVLVLIIEQAALGLHLRSTSGRTVMEKNWCKMNLHSNRCTMNRSNKEMGAIIWVSVIPAHNFTYDGLYSKSNVKCRLSIAQHTNIYFTHTATNCALTGDGDLQAGCGISESIKEDVISWHSDDSRHYQLINVWLSGDTTSNWNQCLYTMPWKHARLPVLPHTTFEFHCVPLAHTMHLHGRLGVWQHLGHPGEKNYNSL